MPNMSTPFQSLISDPLQLKTDFPNPIFFAYYVNYQIYNQ